MKFLQSRKKYYFVRNLVLSLVLLCSSFTILAPATKAQTLPTNIQYTQTVPTDQQTVPVPGGRTETGRVQQVDIPNPFGGIDLSGVVGAITNLPEKIFKYITSHLGEFLKKFVIQALKLVGEVLGIRMDLWASFCNGVFNNLISDASDTAPLSTTNAGQPDFSAFVALDFGLNGFFTSASNSYSSTYLVDEFKSNVLGIRDANAQGQGTQHLGEGIRKVWSKMEQLAIVFMVIALIIIGFMVMLRRRLDPKTVVTATNSLPRFAIALVLIVFSFAISGLFVDFINISVSLVRNFFGGTLSTWSSAFGGEFVWFPLFTAFSLGTAFNWQSILCSPIGGIFPGGTFSILFIALIFEIFIRLMLLIVGIYLFWILIKNFAYMVLYTVFAPLMFLLGAIPGFESVTINWFKRMFVNTIAFPIILFLIYLAMGLIAQTRPVGGELQGAISAPDPLQGDILNIAYFIGMGMIFFATKVPVFLEKMFKLDSFDVKGGLGAGVLAAPVAVPMAGLKAAGNLGRSLSGVTALRGTVGQGLTGLRNAGWGPRPAPTNVQQFTHMGPDGKPVGIKVGEIHEGATENPGLRAKIARGIVQTSPGAEDPSVRREVGREEVEELQNWAGSRGVKFTHFSTDQIKQMRELGKQNPHLSVDDLEKAVKPPGRGKP